MTPRKSFSFKEAYKFAANSTIEHFTTLLKFALVWFAAGAGATIAFLLLAAVTCLPIIGISAIPSLLSLDGIMKTCYVGKSAILLTLIGIVFLVLLSFMFELFSFQLLRLAKAYYEKKTLTISELFTMKGTRFFKFWAARALYYLKIVAGFILLVIPGIYIAYTYCFSGYSIFEGTTDELGEDARISANLTHQVKWRIFFAMVLQALFFGGSRGLYLFVASPIALFILFSIYQQLKRQNGAKEQVTAS